MADPEVREQIAAAVADHLDDETLVNIGIGIPGLVPHYVGDDRRITFHAEHGVVGFGSDRFGPDGEPLSFFRSSYRLRPGGFITDHTRSFALIRSGRIDVTVLGAFQVGADGRIANYQADNMLSGCPGGAPELASAARRVIVATEHRGPSGEPKLRQELTWPPTVERPADLVVTDLGSFVPAGNGFRAIRLASGVTRADAAEATAAPLRWED